MATTAKPVVLIAGVSGGIGMAVAKLFVAKGWIVVGTVRRRAGGAAIRNLQVDMQLADMLRPRDLERVVQTAWRTYGRLDAVVCAAGYGLVGPIDTLDYSDMAEQLAVNTLAPAELARQAVPLMRRQGWGAIVGLSSMAGRAGFAGYSLYSASKFGLEGLFESLAMELAVSNVRVKLVEPSSVNTAFWTRLKRGNVTQPQKPAGGIGDGYPGADSGSRGLSADAVALAVWKAVQDTSSRVRYPLGQTRILVLAQRFLPQRLVQRVLRRILTGN